MYCINKSGIRHAVSQVLSFCTHNGSQPGTKGIAIYLAYGHTHTLCPSVHFPPDSAPTIIWVARSRGLPRSTPSVSRRHRHCGTLGLFPPYPSGHRRFHRRQSRYRRIVQEPDCPYLRKARTLRASQPGRAWTFLYPHTGADSGYPHALFSNVRCRRPEAGLSKAHFFWSD